MTTTSAQAHASAHSPKSSAEQFSNQLAEVIAAAANSVVAVHGRARRPSSGVLWQPGVVVTAEETVERDDGLALMLADGSHVEATLAGRDPSTDIAVLSFAAAADSTVSLARHASAADLRPGHLVLAVGRSDGNVIAAHGIISVAGPAWRSSQGGIIDARLRIDARLPLTAEGGALVGADGNLIGMAVFGPRRSVLAIPASTIDRIVQTIKDKGHIARGYLGVGLQRVPVAVGDSAETRRAAMVVTVDPAGPAKAAGILQGDIIIAVGGTAVTGLRSLYQELGPETVGQKKTVELIRGGARTTVDVTVAARPRG
jgi:S1-C subfamily serine protease